MAATNKRMSGLSIVGFVFAVLGFVLWVSGNTVVGITILSSGVVFTAIALAAARKTPPRAEN